MFPALEYSSDYSCWLYFSLPLTDEARSKQCGILVHCLVGISRSVTVTVAYLMQKLNLSLNDAYDFVKRKKSNISPNFNFMGQLLDFERTLALRSPCDNRSTSKEQLFFTTPTNHNVFQLDTLESTWRLTGQPFYWLLWRLLGFSELVRCPSSWHKQ